MGTKWVYCFNEKKTEGNKDMKNLLGGKGANLAEMSAIGLPVPGGFTVTTEACLDYEKQGRKISDEIKNQVKAALKEEEKLTGKQFGSTTNPLLFSVRSGARVSMPGMMDTVLNLGLNDEAVLGLAKLTNNERFAWDSYRRFIQMYSNVVLEFDIDLLEHALEHKKHKKGVKNDTDLSAQDLKELALEFKKIIKDKSGHEFPNDPMEQLWRAIAAVFNSWGNPRAVTYREMYHYSHDWGTAVNVQRMVFGNMGDDCATGVCFTRDPSTGKNSFYGEFLINAQGEDVVAGIRTPQPINEDSKTPSTAHLPTLEKVMPKCFGQLVELYKKLEGHYRDMQDIEFTIEKDKLYILQTRNGKRTAPAALKIACDLVNEKLITKQEALLRVRPEDLDQLLHPRLDPKAVKNKIAEGLPASPGAGSGAIYFTAEAATTAAEKGKVLLVRQETSPDDITGMAAAQGILTARGGMTSHAAVVARGMGKCCVAGCSDINIDYNKKTMTVKGKVYKEGDFITIDGSVGVVYEGVIPTIPAEITDDFATFMKWADETRRLKVRTNADTPNDCKTAIKFGAEGIGLCRTEHMFFAPERILAVREMIFANTLEEREKALKKLLPFQKGDFIGIFTEMNGKPCNIRLLDPPLHEFLPHVKHEKEELAAVTKLSMEEIERRGDNLHEFNPMLGHRGLRLGVTFPEIYRMQARAIMEAAIECQDKGITVLPEVMIPLTALNKELAFVNKHVKEEIEKVFKEKGKTVKYKLGTMIELPRAAITAAEIAKEAEFFSFGTNDLTQTTFGLSRDDAGKFLPAYSKAGFFERDPFVSLDQNGVGWLVNFACTEGRKVNSHLHLGICGEHGGDPQSVEFCHKVGLDYVSCSPFRVPIARLAAAQAVLKEAKK